MSKPFADGRPPARYAARAVRRSRIAVALLLPLACLSSQMNPAEAQQAGAPFVLRPGVVVDPGPGTIYVMNTDNGIDAVELAAGALLWRSDAAARPLVLEGGRLLGQAAPGELATELGLVIMDAAIGQPVASYPVELPAGVIPSVDDTMRGSFAISALAVAGEALLSWEYVPRPVEGLPPRRTRPTDPELQPEAVISPQVTRSGTVRIDLATGASDIEPLEIMPQPAPGIVDLSATERLSGVAGTQYLSADGNHVLASERVADDSVWDKYEWTIYERATGERLRQLRSHRSVAPFFVWRTSLVYETGPYTRRTDSGLVEVPLMLRAVSVVNGGELWTRQIRDTAYRGPFPS